MPIHSRPGQRADLFNNQHGAGKGDKDRSPGWRDNYEEINWPKSNDGFHTVGGIQRKVYRSVPKDGLSHYQLAELRESEHRDSVNAEEELRRIAGQQGAEIFNEELRKRLGVTGSAVSQSPGQNIVPLVPPGCNSACCSAGITIGGFPSH